MILTDSDHSLDSPAAPSLTRRQPLLTKQMTSPAIIHQPNQITPSGGGRGRSRMGETAGECAAVCCCCPCATVHLFIAAVYRIPAGLLRRAWRRKKRRMLLKRKRRNLSSEWENRPRIDDAFGFYDGDEEDEDDSTEGDDGSSSSAARSEAAEWEREMAERFYGGGFWRSESRRAED